MTFKDVSNKVDFVKLENEILNFWKETDAFNELRRLRAETEKEHGIYSFIDGPITANNPMGVHHAWGRTYKDLYQRYHAMQGKNERWQNGFDCQGLWVEVNVEKRLGFNSKREIEKFGLDKFTNRDSITKPVRKIIERDDLMTLADQHLDHMRADIAGSSGDQNYQNSLTPFDAKLIFIITSPSAIFFGGKCGDRGRPINEDFGMNSIISNMFLKPATFFRFHRNIKII